MFVMGPLTIRRLKGHFTPKSKLFSLLAAVLFINLDCFVERYQLNCEGHIEDNWSMWY